MPTGILDKLVKGIVLIALVNLVVFVMILHELKVPSEKPNKCTIDQFLTATSDYVQTDGRIPIRNGLPVSCADVISRRTAQVWTLKKSIENLVYRCNAREFMPPPYADTGPILTLFTSWLSTDEKTDVHRNTVINWTTFLPQIHIVVFTNETSIIDYVSDRGWTTFPIVHHAAGGAPVLKSMFIKVQKHFRSRFYGFANSDILFTDGLLKTLLTVSAIFPEPTSIMLTGRRINVKFVTPEESASYENIEMAANVRGRLFKVNSEDFFITSASFPWATVSDVVIGRPAYDNWLVAHARLLDAVVIDVTETVPAIHQTTRKGDEEGHKHKYSKYNDKLLRIGGKKPDYAKGFVTCAAWRTYDSLCGNVELERRQELPAHCVFKNK